ncbi:cellulose synthase subunit BcsC-related outer membrane protein [Tunturiibacter lichenicola]|uniref:cellulose synthase subunit BcsC-related outer membrane protein n=1 Tax=Tunturiibacter lichenicola TaxID=2051959 RepID=UPI003D9BACAC
MIAIDPVRVVAADSPALKILLTRAQTQAQSGHLNIAISTWQQVLASDPVNIEALRSIAAAEIQLGNKAEADAYIQRLQKAGASPAIVGELQVMHSRPSDTALLGQAAALAKSGQYGEAIEIYRKVYGNDPPAGDSALVFYDTLAALPAERKHAVQGLRKLARQFPANEKYSIALGRVLTYDSDTRAEGITLLRRFPADRDADDALRKAMSWSERTQTPQDVSALLSASHTSSSTVPIKSTSELGAGYRALTANNLSEADEHFRAALIHETTHGQAHAGLGYVFMKQQDFAGAVREFEKAKEDGDRDANLAQALTNSRFWNSMSAARSAAERQDLESAITDYRNALVLKPENTDAMIALGGTLLSAGRPKEAIPYLQKAVRANAESQAAWRALFFGQSQALEQADAVKTAERIPSSLRTLFEVDPEFMGYLAGDYAAIGEQARADSILKRALALSQGDGGGEPSIVMQLQYASLLMTAKRYNTAIRSYRQILTAAPDNMDAWRGMVTANHLADRDAEALRAYRQTPSAISAAMEKDAGFLSMLAGIYQSAGQIEAARATLKRALKFSSSTALQLQLASLEMSNGDKQYSAELFAQIADEHPESTNAWLGWVQALHAIGHDRDALRQNDEMPEPVNQTLEGNPEYLQTLASIYSALGDKRKASETIAQVDSFYAQQGVDPPPAVQLQQGWLSLQAGENARLSSVIQQLNRFDDLTEDQQTQVAHLWASWSIQRASQLSQQGNRAAAVAVLSVALKAFPDDISVNAALANAYLTNGDAKRSVALYARQDMTEADLSVCTAAINAALVANDRKQVKAWLEISLDRFGQNERVLELAARFEQQRGDQQRAAAYDRAALRAAGPPSIADLTSSLPTGGATYDAEPSARQQLYNLLSQSIPQSKTRLQSRSLGDSEQDRTQGSLEPLHSNQSLNSRVIAGSENDRSDYDIAQPSFSAKGPHRRSKDDSGSDSATLGDPHDEEWAYSPNYKTHPANTLAQPPRKHHLISERDVTLAPTSGTVEDSPGNHVASPSPSAPSTSYHQRPNTRIFSDSATPDIPSYEARALLPSPEDGSALNESTGVIYQNAVLGKIRPPGGVEQILTSDISPAATLKPIPLEPVESLPPLTGMVSPSIKVLSARQQTQQNLDAIESSSSSYFGGDSSVVFHSGQPGFDSLTAYSANSEESMMLSRGARATVVVHPILLESGTAGADAAFQMGTLPLGALSPVQTAAGVGGELQLRTRSFGAAVGYTPRGFLVENVTGRLLIQPDNGPVTLTLERQPIEDTQLSYAGLRDLGSATPSFPGNIWGGVISNAASLQISRSEAASGWYIQGGGQYMTGQHVESNHRIDGFAGAYWSIWNHPEYGKLTLGMNFFGMHYANNQRLFTYGNGGYFSPGAYLLSSVPITFDGVYGSRFHYKVAGSLGLQAFQEDASPYFPIDSALQAAAKNPFTVERISIGANYNVGGEASYLITEHWHVGGAFSVNNSYDYTSGRLSFFLRYSFKPQLTDSITGPTGLVTTRGLRPLFTP